MSDNETPEQLDNEEPGVIAYMFSNDQQATPRLLPLLKMFYRGVYENTVGLMEAKNRDTGNVEMLLVGLEHDENGMTNTFPLAKILDAATAIRYLAPDSEGGWLEDPDFEQEISQLVN